MRIGSLFSGIGGLELGLERAIPGAHVVWQVEINPFCRQVLAKHWPNTPRYEDIRTLDLARLVLDHADLICGGFPCQDVSDMGIKRGMQASRSGLWVEFARVIEGLAPKLAVVENVGRNAVGRWLPTVRRDLHVLGYNTRAYLLSALEAGAPQLRQRVFVVANRRDYRRAECGQTHDDRDLARRNDPDGCRADVGQSPWPLGWEESAGSDNQPALCRTPDGISSGLDERPRGKRLTALGNAVVPQCAEIIGRIIKEELW